MSNPCWLLVKPSDHDVQFSMHESILLIETTHLSWLENRSECAMFIYSEGQGLQIVNLYIIVKAGIFCRNIGILIW